MNADALPPPIDVGTLLTEWSLAPTAVLGCLLAGAWYAVASRRVRRSGARPLGRGAVLAFVAGLSVVAIALASPVDTYADVSFTVHMVQHLLLSFVAPPLLALGRPLTLALRAGTPGTRRRISRVLGSRVVRTLTHPVVATIAFAGAPFALHVSPLYDLALRETWVHVGEHALLLAIGIGFWWPIVAADPLPDRLPAGARVVSLLIVLPAQAFLALAIFAAPSPLYDTYASLPAPFGPDALDDQRSAAALMWVVGAVCLITAMLAVAAGWRRSDEARQRRADAIADARATEPPTARIPDDLDGPTAILRASEERR